MWSIDYLLPNRTNIILTRDNCLFIEGCKVIHTKKH
ncbi:hypothetical protein KHA80_14595 [Anaerobacillus sp. HL2]|nr:hypothetical protein KHA80_14595 [Anaerobacillus sp. HL2]